MVTSMPGVRHAGPMRFTEHELTVAVTAAAKIVARGKVRRRAHGRGRVGRR